jgi:ammonia channel protein AmtB
MEREIPELDADSHRETSELAADSHRIASGILVGLALVTPFWLFVFVVSALLGVLRGVVLALIALVVGLLLLQACLAVRDKWRAWRASRRGR